MRPNEQIVQSESSRGLNVEKQASQIMHDGRELYILESDVVYHLNDVL